ASGLRPTLLQKIELALYDQRLNFSLQEQQDPRVVIIDVDEKSLASIGRWPWSRGKIAELVDVLFDQYQVALLGFDVLFSESYTRIELSDVQQLLRDGGGLEEVAALAAMSGDAALSERLAEHPVVLSMMFDQMDARIRMGALGAPVTLQGELPENAPVPRPKGYVANLPELAQHAEAGFFDNPLVDLDGVYRRTPLLQFYQGDLYPSLALALWQALVLSKDVRPVVESDIAGRYQVLTALDAAGLHIPVDPRGAMLIPYRGGVGSFPYISASDLLDGSADPALLSGAIAILGTSAGGLMDLRTTSVGHLYPGVEVHANILSAMLDQRFLYEPDFVQSLELLALLFCGLLLSLLLPYLSVLSGSLLSLFLLVVVVTFNLYAFTQYQWVLPLATPLLLITLLFMLLQTAGFFLEVRNRHNLARVFGQYVPPEIVRQLQESGQAIHLEGEDREMTVLFSDIRDFTSLSENLSATQLARLINLYLSGMTAIIHRHQGTIDKYIGDAVMAFWGAPLNDPEHARHALQAALAMLEALPGINQALQAEGLPSLSIGVGLSAGQMSVGNMGSSFRVAYTVMGDTVNLGSRLEGLTKYYGVQLLVSESVSQQASDYVYREVDRVRVKGKAKPVGVFQPMGMATALSNEDLAWLEKYQVALQAYRQQQWQAAAAGFAECLAQRPEDKVSGLYQQRIKHLSETPLPADWDGVFDHQSK
ncbi:MAG: CHASE2 domain-containing protein, partial [Pseudomonas sp.]